MADRCAKCGALLPAHTRAGIGNAGVCTDERAADLDVPGSIDVLLTALRSEIARDDPACGQDVVAAAEAIIDQGALVEFGRRVLQLVIERRADALKSRRAEVARSLGKMSIKRVH
jgi:hypothetical protein